MSLTHPPGSAAADKEKIISLLLHDLRPPLQVLRFLTGHLSDGNMDPAMTQVYLQELNNAITELVHSSEAIFTWLEVQRERFLQAPQAIALDTVLQQATDKFSNEYPALPRPQRAPQTPGLQAYTDSTALTIALYQLMRNAAAQSGQQPIVITASREEGMIQVAVHDKGKGMPDKVATNIQEHLAGTIHQPVLFRYGYRIIIRVLQLLEGTISFAQTNEGGTVTLHIPDRA